MARKKRRFYSKKRLSIHSPKLSHNHPSGRAQNAHSADSAEKHLFRPARNGFAAQAYARLLYLTENKL
jgi:hypothetical protein